MLENVIPKDHKNSDIFSLDNTHIIFFNLRSSLKY